MKPQFEVRVLRPFDAYEIHGVVEHDSDCETTSDRNAHFWSLYGHIPGEGLECIGDFKTRKAAEDIYFRITGQPFFNENHKGT